MSQADSLSVVIPVFNASSRLAGLCRALAALDPQPQEFIFCNDGSQDATLAELEKIQSTGIAGTPVVVVSQPNSGPAVARNAGIKAANADWIAFTDDDCEPSPGWLRAYKLAIQSQPGLVCAFGRVEATGTKTFLSHYVENFGEGHQTANALYRRETLVQLGGFDTRFRTPYLEDTELFMRTSELGRVDYVDAALVYHPVRSSTLWAKARRVRMYRNDYLVYQKHHQLYRSRHRGLGPTGYLLYYVMLKHGLATLWGSRGLLIRQPREFGVILTTLVLERILLAAWLFRWICLENLASQRPGS